MTSVPPSPSGHSHSGRSHSGHSPSDPFPSDPSAAQSWPPPERGGSTPAPGSTRAQAGPAPGTDLGADLGAALSFAGGSMLRNPLTFLVSGAVHSFLIIVFLIGSWIAGAIFVGLRTSAEGYGDEPPPGDVIVLLLILVGVSLLALPIAALWASGTARSALIVHEGGRPTIGQALIGTGRVMLTSLLAGAIVIVGLLLCVVPGLIASVLLFYAIPSAARGASPVGALTESIRLVRQNLGTTILGWLIVGVIAYVAAWLVITMLISVPLYVLFQFGLYERLNGRGLPEPARA